MKKILAILVMSVLVFTTAYAVFAGVPFAPPNGCYTPKLVKTMTGTLDYVCESPDNSHFYDFPGYNPNCYYRIVFEAGTCYYGQGYINICGQNDNCFTYPFYIYGNYVETFYWNPQLGTPSTIEIGLTGGGHCPPDLEYTIKIYEECRCKTTLYPKVDIEQFSVSGGPTVIQDGKVISNFIMSPGSQQVMLQVENRGFFTQKDARVRFEGLPSGVTVDITPDTQILKAHNIGTYSATFTVGPNVPSGAYQITMIAYSPTGTFDTITFEFVVP